MCPTRVGAGPLVPAAPSVQGRVRHPVVHIAYEDAEADMPTGRGNSFPPKPSGSSPQNLNLDGYEGTSPRRLPGVQTDTLVTDL
jgi:hypothetical protein